MATNKRHPTRRKHVVKQIEIGGIRVDVELKPIKHLHLRVYPPDGCVRITAPAQVDLDYLRAFVLSRMAWIHVQQKKQRERVIQAPPSYRSGESHPVWGRPYELAVFEDGSVPQVRLEDQRLVLQVCAGTDTRVRGALLERWYRQQLKQAALPLIELWSARMGVQAARLYVRRMKTRWGTCNYREHSIRLNTELARRRPELLEYVVVHELAHLLESSHNARFKALMDRFLPGWQRLRAELNYKERP